VVEQLGRGQLRPVVDAVFPLEAAREACARLDRGEQIGKIAVTIAE
jgi:NADPH:quinone reductase-like Zn-dependent oxidoreductase